MTTLGDWIETTKRYLLGGQTSEELNVLGGAIDADDPTLAVTYSPQGLARGTTIAIDFEEMYVWAVSGSNITVQRGMNGSTAATHDAGAMVIIKPKFSAFRIYHALIEDMFDLSSPENGLFRVLTDELIFTPATRGYPVTGTTMDILDVRYSEPVGNSISRVFHYELMHNVDGTFLMVDGAFPGRTVWVSHRAPFATVPMVMTQNVSISLLPATCEDIPPMGAAVRLVAPREIKRNFSEKAFEPRRAEEVQPGATTNSMRGLALLRQQRILSEAARLAKTYPIYRP